MKKILTYIIFFVILCFGGIIYFYNNPGGRKKVNGNTLSRSVTITDQSGREVTIGLPVRKIAFSHFSTGEALKILNSWDQVAGRSRNLDKNIFNNLDKIPIITGQNVYDLNYEKIFELDIDLFLAVHIPMDGFNEMLSRLEANVPVVALNFDEPATLKENLKKLAMLLDKQTEADAYLKWYDKVLGRMEEKIPAIENKDKPVVFFKTSWGSPEDIQTFTDVSPGISERNNITGCINAAKNIPSTGGWVQTVNPEWLAAQNPDVLVISDIVRGGYGLGINDKTAILDHRKQVMVLPAFSSSAAVKNNRVYMITGEFFGTPRFVIGFAYMAKWFHPHAFKDLSPRSIHQDYLRRFMSVNYDLDKGGVFAYPDN